MAETGVGVVTGTGVGVVVTEFLFDVVCLDKLIKIVLNIRY